MNVELFQVAANLCLEPKFSSGRHRPHSRLNNWHSIDYDEELFTDLSYCDKSKSATDIPGFSNLQSDFSVLKERKCSTSTPIVPKNLEKCKVKDTSESKGRLYSLKETNDTCDSSFGENAVINTFANCTLQTPIPSFNGHQKCSNIDLELDCPIFLQPLPCMSLESLFDSKYDKELRQCSVKDEQDQNRTEHSSDSGFESQYSGCNTQSDSNINKEISFNEKLTKLLEKYSPKNPEALIGRRIGEEHVDIMGLLQTKHIDPAIWKICDYLGADDLCSFRCVSPMCNSIVANNKSLVCRWKQHVTSKRVPPGNKENKSKISPRKQAGLTGGKGTPLCCLQPTAKSRTTSSHSLNIADTTPTSTHSTGPLTRHQLFVKAASTLRLGECLRKCPLCNSPSRTDSGQERAWCMGVNCKYDFCIKCRSPFHGSKPCTMGVSKKTRTEGGGVGSRKSKKNLRRL